MRNWNPNDPGWNSTTPGVPPLLNAGDTWQFTVSYPQYPAVAGWSASLTLVSPDTSKTFTSATNPNGNDFDFLIPVAVTSTLRAGPYTYRVFVTGSGTFVGQQFTAEQSRVTVAPILGAGYDGTSVAEQQLVLCEAAIQAVLAGKIASGSLGGQSFQGLSLSELLQTKKELLATIRNEANALRIAQGLNSGRQIHVRFKNV